MAQQTWNFDPSHSTIGFAVRHMVIAKVRGRFTKWNGAINYDVAAPERSSVTVKIEVASVDTNEPQRDAHLRSPDFFDVEKHPEIVFKSRRIEMKGAEAARVVGDLTLHGTTREVALDVELGGRVNDPWGNERMGITARGRINRHDFGLKWNQLLEAGGAIVGDSVDLELEVEAVHAAKQAEASATP